MDGIFSSEFAAAIAIASVIVLPITQALKNMLDSVWKSRPKWFGYLNAGLVSAVYSWMNYSDVSTQAGLLFFLVLFGNVTGLYKFTNHMAKKAGRN